MITALPRIAIAVPDFSATLSLFRDGLGFAVVDISEASASDLGAKIAAGITRSSLQPQSLSSRTAPTWHVPPGSTGLGVAPVGATEGAAEGVVVQRGSQ